MQTHVTFERRDDVGTFTFACDEPGKPTTLDLQVLDELDTCLDEVEACVEDLRALIVQSDSPKYFLVGANVNALRSLDATSIVPWVQRGHQVFNRLARLPLPVIARVEGYALGGGLELAMACDLIVAAEGAVTGGGARFGQPEAKLGVVAGWGGSGRLPRRVGLARAKELFFTGRIVDAAAAHAMGLADFVGDVDAIVADLVDDIRPCGWIAVASMKQLLDRGLDLTLEQIARDEAVASSRCLADPDTQARVARYLEGRKR